MTYTATCRQGFFDAFAKLAKKGNCSRPVNKEISYCVCVSSLRWLFSCRIQFFSSQCPPEYMSWKGP